MNLLQSFEDLKEYQEDIIKQREVLQTSKAFTYIDKNAINEIYNELEKIVSSRIYRLQDVDDALKA